MIYNQLCFYACFLILLGWPESSRGQDRGGSRRARLVFYNTENLFDPFDDSLAQDEEFLPDGIRHWTWDRFLAKQGKIFKVLAASGAWQPPELIGLCEIENRFVLNWLTGKTPLMKYGYRIVHYESPDERGIDVALLYREGYFLPLYHRKVPAGNGDDPTRDILYVKGTLGESDTLHLILCHWPSRWRGYYETLPARMEAAVITRCLVDSIIQGDPGARILLAGDLNDELQDPSVSAILRVEREGPVFDSLLYHTGSASEVQGTLRYRGRWYEFDHIFANGVMLRDTCLFVRQGGKKVFCPDYLLENDPHYPGRRPFRTFTGYRYLGGFSDHLPVYIDLYGR